MRTWLGKAYGRQNLADAEIGRFDISIWVIKEFMLILISTVYKGAATKLLPTICLPLLQHEAHLCGLNRGFERYEPETGRLLRDLFPEFIGDPVRVLSEIIEICVDPKKPVQKMGDHMQHFSLVALPEFVEVGECIYSRSLKFFDKCI
jgi:hypothetical protein